MGSVRLKGTGECKTGGLTYIPDNQSVDASSSLPPAPHSGKGPVIEAVRVPGKEHRQLKQPRIRKAPKAPGTAILLLGSQYKLALTLCIGQW